MVLTELLLTILMLRICDSNNNGPETISYFLYAYVFGIQQRFKKKLLKDGMSSQFPF